MKFTTRLIRTFLIAAMLVFGIGGLNPCPAAALAVDKPDSIVASAIPETLGTLSTLGADLTQNANIIVTGYTAPLRVFGATTVGIAPTFAVTTPGAKTFTCVAATDVCTAASSGFLTGLKMQGTTTTTLPAGLSLSTDYFWIYITATTGKVATSYANAILGTAINITDTGTGTHTFTPTTLAGGAASLQGSIDGANWFDIGSSSQNVTAAGTLVYSITSVYYPWARLKFINTAGVLTASTKYAIR